MYTYNYRVESHENGGCVFGREELPGCVSALTALTGHYVLL